jgi:hypothetical protein
MSLLGAGDQPGAINKVVRARTISNHALQSTLQVSYRRIKAETMRALSRRELAVYMPSGSASNITTRHCELHLFLCHRPCPFSWLSTTNHEFCGVFARNGSTLRSIWTPHALTTCIYGGGTVTRRLVRHEFCHAAWEPWPPF